MSTKRKRIDKNKQKKKRMGRQLTSVLSSCNHSNTNKTTQHHGRKTSSCQSRVGCLRLSFVFSLLASAATCGVIAYTMIRTTEHSVATNTYYSVVDAALFRAKTLTHLKIEGATLLADLYKSSFPNKGEWPFVSLPGFKTAAIHAGLMSRQTSDSSTLTQVNSFAFSPFVSPDQISEFETYAEQVITSNGYPEGSGYTEGLGFSVYAAGSPGKQSPYKSTGDGNGYNSTYRVAAPIFQFSDFHAPVIMFDLHSSKNVGPWIESLIDCSSEYHQEVSPIDHYLNNHTQESIRAFQTTPECMFVTTSHYTMVYFEPTLNIGAPIILHSEFEKDKNETTNEAEEVESTAAAVGMVTTVLRWTAALTDITPKYIEGLECVITSTGPTDGRIRRDDDGDEEEDHNNELVSYSYSYSISHGEAKLIGEGDLHDTSLDEYGRSTTLIDTEFAALASSSYTLTIYPTRKTFEYFYTTLPLAVGLGLACVIGFCTFVFLIYDFFVKDEARRRKAILEMKRRFVRFVSHEIRTPLNVVCMGLELLQQEMKSTAEIYNDDDCGPELRQSDVHNNTASSAIKRDATRDNAELRIPKMAIADWFSIMDDLMENCQNSVAVLNDILSYDKIEAGTFHLEVEAVDINALIRKTVSEFQILAKNQKIELCLVEEKYPKCLVDNANDVDLEEGYRNPDFRVMGDGTRLNQVLRNLISNALKFTPEHQSVKVVVTYNPDGLPVQESVTETSYATADIIAGRSLSMLSSESSNKIDEFGDGYLSRRSGSIIITIEDQGVGMDEHSLSVVFGEGVQIDPNKLQHGNGSGLGLFIARNIVLQHGGNITATSDGPGKGASFAFELPIYTKEESESEDNSISNIASAKSQGIIADAEGGISKTKAVTQSEQTNEVPDDTPTKQRRVLVVEDVLSNSKLLVRILERAGCSCATAMNGKEAVEFIENDMKQAAQNKGHIPIDTVLMDYEMPIMNGPDAAKKIRDMGWTNYIFGVTGNVLSEDVTYFKEHGADQVIPKPVKFAAIEDSWTKPKHYVRTNYLRKNSDNALAA